MGKVGGRPSSAAVLAVLGSGRAQVVFGSRLRLWQIFDALRELMTPPDPPKRPIGFVNPEDKGKKTSAKNKG